MTAPKHTRRGFVVGLAFLTLLPLSAACSSPAAADGVTRVDGARARELVGQGATLLDVRTPGEYASRHIEGATNIPVDALAGRLADVPRDHPVVVYCQSGARSARAAGILAAAGYETYDLGGIGNW